MLSHSVMSVSLQPHGLKPARLLCPWGFSRQEYWSGLPYPHPGKSSQPRDQTQVSLIASRFFTSWATREVQCNAMECKGPWKTKSILKMNKVRKLRLPKFNFKTYLLLPLHLHSIFFLNISPSEPWCLTKMWAQTHTNSWQSPPHLGKQSG